MAKIMNDRMAAEIEGDFVVFLIGMRINKLWKINKWLPPFLAMPRMIKELEKLPSEETGFLGHNGTNVRHIVFNRVRLHQVISHAYFTSDDVLFGNMSHPDQSVQSGFGLVGNP